MSKIIKQIGQIDRQIDKTAIIELAKQHAHEILESGQYDLLKVYIEFKRYEVYLKTLMNELKDGTTEQAKEIGDQSFEYGSAKVSISKLRKFDYSNDDYWKALKGELQEVKVLKKEREKLLKSIKGTYQDIENADTGELERIVAPSVEYTRVLRITL